MQKIWHKLSFLGVNDTLPIYTQKILVLLNRIALSTFIFSTFTYWAHLPIQGWALFATSMLPAWGLTLLITVIYLYLNAKGMIVAARFVLVVAGFGLLYALEIFFILTSGWDINGFYSLRSFKLLYIILAVIAFGFKERRNMLALLLPLLLIFLFQDYLFIALGASPEQLSYEAASYINNKIVFYVWAAFVLALFIFLLQINDTFEKKITSQNQVLNEQQNELITQNEELYQQREEIAAQRDYAESLYQQLQKKDHFLTQSLQYAQTIQKIILPEAKTLQGAFAQYFVIYLPKDIVSGDFYWFFQTPQYTYLAVADCTGHGVAGAFMTLITKGFLDSIVAKNQVECPANILNQLHDEIQNGLRQSETNNQDGLTIGLIRIEKIGKQAYELVFAGSKQNLYLFDNQELIVFKGERNSIGGMLKEKRDFQTQIMQIKSGQRVYMSTDGFFDTPNPQRKALSEARFKEILQACQSDSLPKQSQFLLEQLQAHQKTAELRDDVAVVGVELV
ncbi:MAG: SpoIIE family protein phosphatase [Microscillaceae bacterium]|jgi:serine phosphatase RsbU (regulator of sigma subunit)|nr:SpoIIE family protein phosphatase [Microscillaceae bacterium]